MPARPRTREEKVHDIEEAQLALLRALPEMSADAAVEHARLLLKMKMDAQLGRLGRG